MRLYVTTDDQDDRSFGRAFVDVVAESAARVSAGRHVLAADGGAADAILIIKRGSRYGEDLLSHPEVLTRPGECFVYDADDVPIAFLPGIYVSLPARRFRATCHRAYGYLTTNNEYVDRLAGERDALRPDLLLSFMGSATSRTRKRLFRRQSSLIRRDVLIENTSGWSNWIDSTRRAEGRRRYAEVLGRSKFVLCPRGGGTATFRQFEAMQMGRVPVIVSDEWIPPLGPEWDLFSLRLRERDLQKAGTIVESMADRADEMGRAARQAWEEWFSPNVVFARLADAVEQLQATCSCRRLGQHRWRLQGRYWTGRDALRRSARSLALKCYSIVGRNPVLADQPPPDHLS